MMRDLDFVHMLSEHLERYSLAYDFNKLIKIIGFVLKKIKMPNYFKEQIADSSVQDMFEHVKGEDEINYFYVVALKPPQILQDYEKIIIDDKVKILIIETLFNKFDVDKIPEPTAVSFPELYNLSKNKSLSNCY